MPFALHGRRDAAFSGSELRPAEGGVAWAATLLNDIVEHFEKRNPEALLANLDPATLDVDLMCEIADKYGDARFTSARLRQQPHHSRGSKIGGWTRSTSSQLVR